VTPKQLLLEAALLVERAAGTLDSSEHRCPTCSGRRFNDFEAAKLARELDTIINRLRKGASELKR